MRVHAHEIGAKQARDCEHLQSEMEAGPKWSLELGTLRGQHGDPTGLAPPDQETAVQ